MISQLTINGIASYKQSTAINNLKQVNLFYGLNGTGKTTLTQYLAKQGESVGKFQNCSLTLQSSTPKPEILVYNPDFVKENFLSTDPLKGIFTLDKANAEAETAINNARAIIKQIENEKIPHSKTIEINGATEKSDKDSLIKAVWVEKATYENSAMRTCLEGFMGSKDAFLNKILLTQASDLGIDKINQELTNIQAELEELDKDSVEKRPLHQLFDNNITSVELDKIFEERIVGSKDSYLKELMEKLSHTDWVNHGITHYLDKTDDCPFCKRGMDDALKAQIKSHIDATYQEKLKELNNIKLSYQENKLLCEGLINGYKEDAVFIKNLQVKNLLENLQSHLNENLLLIDNKIKEPSSVINLNPTKEIITEINNIITSENTKIIDFNQKLENREKAKKDIKDQFWKLLRKKHSVEIESYNKRLEDRAKTSSKAQLELKKILDTEKAQNDIIVENQQKTKNVEIAVKRINNRLRCFGLEGFEISRVNSGDDNHYFYEIVRDTPSGDDATFHTLSEGEKTLISFLYFIELCVGVADINKSGEPGNRIIVIDDPISSLSLNLVFDISVLIKDLFLTSNIYRQVFILTHHLYFLHEFLGMHPELKKTWSLYRVTKNSFTSVNPMSKEDIKNNYEGYWQLLKDAKEGKLPKVALPNAIRNICEQYFSFVHGHDDLKAALKKLSEDNGNDPSYKSFDRYINRESHSDATNFIDINEIDTDKFLKYFECMFTNSGHKKHYQIMIGDSLIANEDNVIDFQNARTGG